MAEIKKKSNSKCPVSKKCGGCKYIDMAYTKQLDIKQKAVAELAEQIKKDFYGNRIVMFAPLYLSNYCVNGCVYCPYHLKNKCITRKKEEGKRKEKLRDISIECNARTLI